MNPVFNSLTEGVYKNLLDPNKIDQNLIIKHKKYESMTLNILLWKLRLYNQYTRYFIDELYNCNEKFRIDANISSMRELITYIVKLFIDNSSNIDEHMRSNIISDELNYMLDIIKYNKLPNENYKMVTKVKETLNIIKDIHNVLCSDEDNNYMFISLHLKQLFNIIKNIILQSNILN